MECASELLPQFSPYMDPIHCLACGVPTLDLPGQLRIHTAPEVANLKVG